jgi:hypothetical protein
MQSWADCITATRESSFWKRQVDSLKALNLERPIREADIFSVFE